MDAMPRALRDGFLGGYLPYLVMLHFDTLDALGRAQDLPSVAARLQALPLRGPETVSRVLMLEGILTSQRLKPPPPPRSGEECARWAQAIDQALHRLEIATASGELRTERDDAFSLPRRAGAIVGDLEHGLALSLLVAQLLREKSDHAFLVRQRDALIEGIRAAPRAKHAMTGVDPRSPFARGIALALRLVEEGEKIAADPSVDTIASTLSFVRRSARAIERSYVERGPSDAIAARARREIDPDALERALLAHPSWSTSASRPVEDGTYFVASSPAVLAPWAAATGRGAAATELGAGWQWAIGATPEVKRAIVNPMSEVEHVIDDAAWPAFRLRALEAMIASVWGDWSAIDLPLLRLAPHAVVIGEGGTLAPIPWTDELGRPFAAIFTSEASLRRGLEAMKLSIPAGARIATAPGREIAARLLAAGAPGLVVDPASAARPRTFSRGTLDRLATVE